MASQKLRTKVGHELSGASDLAACVLDLVVCVASER